MKRLTLLLFVNIFAFGAIADTVWHNEAEIGSTIVTGNSQTSTLNAADKTAFKWDENSFKFNARYLQASANGVESAKNWDGAIRYERALTLVISAYASFGLDSDIYSGYVQRANYDIGGKYILSASPATNWSAELGYRNSFAQFVTPAPNAQSNFVRVYSEINQTLAANSSFKFWFEYLPNVADSSDYRFNFEPSVTLMLSDMFSLKAADLIKYQNQLPPKFSQYLDSFFTLSLVSKF